MIVNVHSTKKGKVTFDISSFYHDMTVTYKLNGDIEFYDKRHDVTSKISKQCLQALINKTAEYHFGTVFVILNMLKTFDRPALRIDISKEKVQAVAEFYAFAEQLGISSDSALSLFNESIGYLDMRPRHIFDEIDRKLEVYIA